LSADFEISVFQSQFKWSTVDLRVSYAPLRHDSPNHSTGHQSSVSQIQPKQFRSIIFIQKLIIKQQVRRKLDPKLLRLSLFNTQEQYSVIIVASNIKWP
jgi:hypothetical protein